jgi:lactobin A/cerein 7B family class IIb bacteriocin
MTNFVELSNNELCEIDGGIGLLALIGLGILALGAGVGAGYGLSKLLA